MAAQIPQRDRRDHHLPKGYLNGFVHPSNGKLSVYDAECKRWSEKHPSQVGWVRGFYDYCPGSIPDQTADQAFTSFENKFPNLRKELIDSKFSGWAKHLEFLLEYAQMLRARTKLFRKQEVASAQQRPLVRVKDVCNDPRTGLIVRVEELTESKEQRETIWNNMAITTMRSEIQKGGAFFATLHWCLRFTDPANPVITSDTPIIVREHSPIPTLQAAFERERFQIFFPVCRHACLIGRPAKWDVETEIFDPLDLKDLQSSYFRGDSRFVYSPKRFAQFP